MNTETVQLIVAMITFTLYMLSPLIGCCLWVYLFTTSYWWLSVLYLGWHLYDKDTPDTGGRPVRWLQRNKVWALARDYFPVQVSHVPDFKLDSTKNYLFCFFPHGIIPLGPFLGLTNGGSEFRKMFPDFEVQIALLKFILQIPFTREIWLGNGLVSCNSKSINHILSRPEGGRIVLLSPGGAQEAYYCGLDQYRFIIKQRKGFIKMALRTGAPLVPVITFGEIDLFKQIKNERVRIVQEFIRKWIGLAPVLFYGRGLTANSVGWIPRRVPLMTVLGKPIEVCQNANPTNEEIDKIHEVFVQELENLFESYKGKYISHENTNLILE